MGNTPIAVGNTKRVGQMAQSVGFNDEDALVLDAFWAVATETLIVGEVLTRDAVTPNLRLVRKANGIGGGGLFQVVCGVALTAAAAGEKVRVLRRGIHAAVVMVGPGAPGNAVIVSTGGGTPGQGESIGSAVSTPAQNTVGIQLESGTGIGPFRASVFVSCYF